MMRIAGATARVAGVLGALLLLGASGSPDGGSVADDDAAGRARNASTKEASQHEKAHDVPQEERDAKATALVAEGDERLSVRDFDDATAKYMEALNQRPSRLILGPAYRGLGTASANRGDTKSAGKWFKLYQQLAETKTGVGDFPEDRERRPKP